MLIVADKNTSAPIPVFGHIDKASGNVLDENNQVMGKANADGKTYTPAETTPTAPTTPETPKAPEKKADQSKAINNYYAITNGTLNYMGQPYTGYYQDKYYENGQAQSPEQVKQDFISKYGTQAAFIASVPELSGILNDAIKNNWSADQWKMAYQNSAWYKSAPTDAYRNYELTRTSDPVAFSSQYNNLLKQIQIQAQSEGYDISAFGNTITSDQVKNLDPNAPIAHLMQQYFGSSVPTDILNRYIANHATIAKTSSGVTGGTLAATANGLKQYAASMGVSSSFLTPSWPGATQTGDYFTNAADAIQKGLTTQESEQNLYKQQAMNIYKPFANAIANGSTLASAANPWISRVSSLLEISPDQVLSNLGSDTSYGSILNKALAGDGTNATDLYTMSNQIRSLPQWLNTENAKTSIMDSTTQLLKNFGLVNQ